MQSTWQGFRHRARRLPQRRRLDSSVTDVYQFIDAEYATRDNAPAVTQMCAWLEVSKSGFYDWKTRPESATAERRAKLALIIRRIFDDSDSTYGYRRIAGQLARQGTVASPELVRKIMRQLGLVACQPRPWRPVTTQQGQAGPIPDLVNRDFSAEVPGQKMVGDITYIPTWQGSGQSGPAGRVEPQHRHCAQPAASTSPRWRRKAGISECQVAHSCSRRLIHLLGGMSSRTSRSGLRDICRCKASSAWSLNSCSFRA